MPFNIWCGSNAEDPDPNVKGCRKHIGIGVRYNAEKTRVAMYYTTPVYQFKIRCHMCSNPITIKTDPGNMDYIVVSGGRRVEQRWDPTGNGQVGRRTREWEGSWRMMQCSGWSTSRE